MLATFLFEMIALILAITLVTVARGDITGTNPPNGACLCFSGSSVNIRSSACGPVIGTSSFGQCFAYAGSNKVCSHRNKNFQFFQINFHGIEGWSTGVYLDLNSDDKCDSLGAGLAANSNEYTCQLTDQGKRVHESSSHTPYDCVDTSCKNTCKGGQCVAYVKCRCTKNGKYPPSTGVWKPGQKLKTTDGKCNRNIAANTAIATFPSNNKYSGHAAVFIKCVDDNTVQVYDQWCGRGVGYSTYSLSTSPYNSLATITSLSDGPASFSCRSEVSGGTKCPASVEGC